ncbi:MAG TPA: alpha/beta hydrolase [Acidimicrobiales bacterium]|nr:alpha/beta hydrolase [Acidimicrobiales bacterium]
MSEILDSAERFVQLSHGRTRYFDVGGGAPTILLHGVGFSAGGTSWYRNIEQLSESLRVIAVDLVGWGVGDRLEQGYSFAYLVDFVREFQDALGLGSSNIVGHSMGGWIASLFAYESPERVDRLALTASGGTATRTLAQMTEFQPPTKEATYERIVALPGISEAEARDWTEYDWTNIQTPDALGSYRKILANMNVAETRSRYNTLRRLPLISARTLVAWGTHDEVNDITLGQKTAELIPDARLVTFDCGHMVPHEAPAELNEALLEFFLA